MNHYPCLLISIKPADKTLVISTQLPRDSLLENAARNDSDFGTEKKSETIFNCKELLQAQSWNHVAVAMQKPGLRGKAKVTLFINGQPMATQKVTIIRVCLQFLLLCLISCNFSFSSSPYAFSSCSYALCLATMPSVLPPMP